MKNRIRKKLILSIINHFLSGTHFFGLKRFLLNRIEDVSVGIDSKIVGPLYLYGALTIGMNTWVGHDFRVEGNGCVFIGDNCDIAPLVTCFTGGHQIGNHNRRAGAGITQNICVGNGCWIGGKATLLYGINISDGSIIAAGAVVNKSIASDSLVGGIPATLIKHL